MSSSTRPPAVQRGLAGITFDRVADVVVVGTGAGGCSAALNARRAGAEVVMVEKRDEVGGTTGKSGGWYWMPNNRWMRALGIEDPKADVLRYMARLTRPERYDPDHPHLGLAAWEYALIDAFYDHASDAADVLVDMDALQSVHAIDFPDYYAHLAENKAPKGRVLIPASPEGELGTGADMIRMMMVAIEREGIDVLTSHPVTQLVLDDDGRAVGVVTDHEGERTAIGARRAVIFASGGYGQSEELRRELLAGPILAACAASGSTGDFLRIANELGAPLRNTGHPWMSPAVLERGLRNRADLEMTFQATGDSMIEVDREGVRVTNEKLQYNEQTLTHWEWDTQRAEYRNLLLFMIWDQPVQDLYADTLPGNPVAPIGVDDDHVVHGDTLEELAEALRVRLASLSANTGGFTLSDGFAEQLPKTVATFNAYARDGVDPEFHRGETPIEEFFNSFHGAAVRFADGPVREGSEGSPTMAPIADTGPYYATILAPGMLDTKGGPIIDTKARVLDGDGRPIPGLYGVGNCVASPSAKAYWAGGATLGPALTFGYIAGGSAAAEPVVNLPVPSVPVGA